MIDHDLRNTLDQQLRTLQILSFAFAGSLVVYVALAAVLIEVAGLEPLLDLDSLVPIVIVLAGLAMLPLAEVVSRSLRNRTAPSHQPVSAETAMHAYSQATIVGFAIREACGVLGFVLSILTANWLWVTILSLVSFVAMLVAWPRAHSVQEWLVQNPGIRRD